MKDEALRLALEALEGMYIPNFTMDDSPINNAITAIKQALEQPEPVECMCGICKLGKREWQGLTDEEIKQIEETTTCEGNESWLRNLTRNIEAKLREKNT
jgi:hypothetical protein